MSNVEKYRRLVPTLAPIGWLDDPTSVTYLGAHGAEIGRTFDLLIDAVKVRYASTTSDAGLVYVGEARQIEQAPGETDAAYRVRLGAPFTTHRNRTTKGGYKNALIPLGVDADNIVVWNDHEDSFLPASDWWSRVIVVVDSTGGPWSAPLWFDADVWTDTAVWGIEGMTQAQLAYMRRIIRRYKWAGAYPLGLAIIFDNSTFGLTTTWADQLWIGSADLVVLPLGRVWGWNETIYGFPDVWSDVETWADNFTF